MRLTDAFTAMGGNEHAEVLMLSKKMCSFQDNCGFYKVPF